MRPGGRKPDELRAVRLTRGYTRHPEGSVLVEFGDTRVLCTASVEERVPPFLRDSGRGWVTAEYGMLPRATNTRGEREASAGKKLKFVIDCAAETNVLSSKLPEKVFDNVTITGRRVLTGVGNRKVEALYGDLKNMKLGNYDLGTLPMLITNLENTCFAYAGCIDGILGFDFLEGHRIGFNFVKRKMYIWK